MTAIGSAEWPEHPGSVGRAARGAVHIADEDGTEHPPGEVGTVWFSGGGSFAYHKDPADHGQAAAREGPGAVRAPTLRA
ncbi:MAG: fadD [Pseudonocardia sp.]|jgi:long-chain acyl-CoA synthetase|nr:fadD [Pseudonocardia sp.]